MRAQSLWLILAIGNLIAAFWLSYIGVVAWVLAADITYISLIIAVLYMASYWYLVIDLRSTKSFKDKFEVPYFIANHLPALGLLGTVIGLMYAVNAMMGLEIDVQDQSTIVKLMQQMFAALGTALVTTIVGLIASLALKAQILVLNAVHKHEIK